jgi:hypothetical protein
MRERIDKRTGIGRGFVLEFDLTGAIAAAGAALDVATVTYGAETTPTAIAKSSAVGGQGITITAPAHIRLEVFAADTLGKVAANVAHAATVTFSDGSKRDLFSGVLSLEALP